MTCQDLAEIPRIQLLEQQFRSSNLRFEGYLNFALSKAIQAAGPEPDRARVIDLVVEILEDQLQSRPGARVSSIHQRLTGLLGLSFGRRRKV